MSNIQNAMSWVGGGIVTMSSSTGAATYSTTTANGFLYGSGTDQLTATAAATDGQILIGKTGNAPVAATLTAGTNISVTNGAGAITVNCSVAGLTGWATETGTSRTLTVNQGVICNNASQVSLTLPATAAVGDRFEIISTGAAGAKLLMASGQTAYLNGQACTTTTGNWAGASPFSFYVICTVANTSFVICAPTINMTWA